MSAEEEEGEEKRKEREKGRQVFPFPVVFFSKLSSF